MLKHLLVSLLVFVSFPVFAQSAPSGEDLRILDRKSTVITKQMGNGNVTLDLVMTLWNRPRFDNGMQDIYRDIKTELLHRFRIEDDYRDSDRWKRDTRIGANQHCFILINDFEVETGRRLIYFGCGRENAALLGADEYWRLKDTFFQQFGRAFRRVDSR